VSEAEQRGDVHVFWSPIAPSYDAELEATCLELLGPAEVEQHARFLRDSDRNAYLIAHALMRLCLSKHSSVAPHTWVFSVDKYGRPEIAAPRMDPPLHFNISHTKGLVACAVTHIMEVGVDVEFHKTISDMLGLAESVFSVTETRALRSLPPAKRRDRFFTYWTLKEAYIKARGMGLSLPLDKFSFQVSDEGGPVSIAIEPEIADSPQGWHFRQMKPSDQHHLALAVRAPPGSRPIIRFNAVPDLEQMLTTSVQSPKRR
jgi:4'-phosphopantetheinyl transferase